MDDINTLRRILKESRVIAVVGLSADWFRPSYFAAKYMQEHGYRVIPVNPKYETILGEKCYKSLREIPEPVDLVDVFRKTQDVGPIADDAISIGAKVLWQQLGVKNEAAAAKARAAGLDVVGFFHSHPDHPARPSAFDLENAWPFYSYLIVSVERGRAADSRSWRLAEDRSAFEPETLEILPEADPLARVPSPARGGVDGR